MTIQESKTLPLKITRDHITIVILCFVLTIFNCYLKLVSTPTWFDGTLERNHNLLLNFAYANNEQSRLLQFLIPQVFIQLFDLSIPWAYVLQRFIFTFLTFLLFNVFCKKWLNGTQALLCTLTIALLIPLTYRNHLQESAPLLGLTFLFLLWAIRENKILLYSIFLVIGSLNNETVLFMPAIYFLVNLKEFKLPRIIHVGLRTVFFAAPALLCAGTLRWITRDRPHLGGAWHFVENLNQLYYPLLFLNIFWFLPFINFKRVPHFLKRCITGIPLFIIPHLVIGIISETRLMIPLCFILIPASMVHVDTNHAFN